MKTSMFWYINKIYICKKLIKLLLVQLFFVLNVFSSEINIKSIYDLLPIHPEIEYIKCHDAQYFSYEKFPISKFPQLQPNECIFSPTFILKIPKGQVYSYDGIVIVGNEIVEESIYPNSRTNQIKSVLKMSFVNLKQINGKVAVITTTSDYCYFHWIANVLVRLALLELYGIEYDWLYVGQDKPFMKETLSLWGIDLSKIILPINETKYIQADELVVPSPYIGMRTPFDWQYKLSWIPIVKYCKIWNLDPAKIYLQNNEFNVANDTPLYDNISIQNYFHQRTPLCSTYIPLWAINYIRNKFLPCIESCKKTFSKKVFISRADATARNMINEDEVFKLFEEQGFTRYILSNLSISEQFSLFANADFIVAAHGAALVNILFCKPNTTIIEIFQGRSDSCFYYLSQLLNLNHYCVQTMDIENIDEHQRCTNVPLFIIKNFINKKLNNKKIA